MRGPIGCLLLALLSTGPAEAVIVQGGDGTQNETGTNAGSGWDYVGSVEGAGLASGVYLGDYGGSYWVLSAKHVGAGTFTLNGVSYDALADSAVLLGADIDLVLFRIEADPGLAALDLAESTPALGASLTMIGYGYGRETSATYWLPNWTETSIQALGTYKGYKWTSPQAKRWGTNTVAGFGSGGQISTETFYTTFGTGTAQATVGDSGGGVFLSDGTLAGIMVEVSSVSGQPGSTSIYSLTGASRTYIVDLSAYRSQILDIVTTSPVPEPKTWMLVLLGGALSVMMTRRRR